MRLAPGDRLGRFEIVGLLGAGAMGEVYRARDPDLDRHVAIKVLPVEVSADPARLERFEREARAVGRLDHPNLLAIHDLGRHDGAPYLVCELLEGETLRTRIARGSMSPREALHVAAQMAAGLAAAHDRGVVHRDLKPANVFLTAGGRAKVLDFGLAKLAGPERPGASQLPTMTAFTEGGVALGTAAYMAPEQAAGRAVDYRADQFALGVVLYEMLAGRRPFDAETAAETLSAILRDEPPPLARAAPHVPPPVRWIVERCLARHPEERYDSTRDLARDLQTAGSGTTESIAQLMPPDPAGVIQISRSPSHPTGRRTSTGTCGGSPTCSSSTAWNDVRRATTERRGGPRMRMIWPGVIERAIAIVEEAPFLTEAQKRDILYDNAARFLRLSDDEIARHHGM